MYRKLFGIILGIGLAFVISIGADHVLSVYLNSHGYFKAMPPYLTNIYDTFEFDSIATISAQGLRNDIVTMPKPKGVYRILAIGDSFTFGWGVDLLESWPKRLEQKFREEGKAVEIINAGFPGAGPMDERYVCKAYKDQFDVDAIMWGAYTDDLYQSASRDANTQRFWAMVNSIWRTFPRLHQPIIGLVGSAWPNVPLTVKTSDIWKKQANLILKKTPRFLLRLDPTIRSTFISGGINADLVGRAADDPGFLTFIFQKPLYNYALSVFNGRVAALESRCTEGKPLMVVYLPGSSLVSESYLQFKKKIGFDVDPRLTMFDIDSPFKKIVEKYGFDYVSVLSDFRSDGCPGCYYNFDGHFTQVGHKRTADFLFPRIEEWLQRQ